MSAVDWAAFQKCDTCGALLGKPCIKLLGFVAARGVFEVEVADAPHTGRELRKGYSR